MFCAMKYRRNINSHFEGKCSEILAQQCCSAKVSFKILLRITIKFNRMLSSLKCKIQDRVFVTRINRLKNFNLMAFDF
jgi:hypothetical protein